MYIDLSESHFRRFNKTKVRFFIYGRKLLTTLKDILFIEISINYKFEHYFIVNLKLFFYVNMIAELARKKSGEERLNFKNIS